MPCIFKRPDCPFYVCSFVAADGRRLKKSTKTGDRRKALEFCLLLEKAAMKARRNELTAAQGRKLIAEMVTISSGEQMTAHTVRGWLEEWLSNKKASAGATSGLTISQHARRFHDSSWQPGRMRHSPQSLQET